MLNFEAPPCSQDNIMFEKVNLEVELNFFKVVYYLYKQLQFYFQDP